MPHAILLFLFLLVPRIAPAQAILDSLATRVCACLHNEPEIIYPHLQATRCMNEVTSRYASSIRQELNLTVELPDDRRRLTELLIEPLTTGCPLLQELAPGKREPELRYSDFPLARAPDGSEIVKHPPPDPAATTLREGEKVLRASGTLLASAPADTLSLRLESGAVMHFLITSRQLRRRRLLVGQPIAITYRYDWRADEKQAVPVVLTIE